MSITKSDAAQSGTRMLTAFFATRPDAEQARAELMDAGISGEAIKITDGAGTVTGDDAASGPPEDRSLLNSLKKSWSAEKPARSTDGDGEKQPGFIVTAHVSADDAALAERILAQKGRATR